MKIFFVREDGKGVSKTAKFLGELNGILSSNISIFTSETEDALNSARIIREAIGVRRINKCSWLNYYNYGADRIKCPIIIRKVCGMVVKNKKKKRIILVTHLDEIREVLKWAIEKEYRMILDGKIENGSVIAVSMNEEEKLVEKAFTP